MSTPWTSVTHDQKTTPPSSFTERPLTPPPTDEKQSPQVPRVLALFKQIQTGRHNRRDPWTEFQLAEGEYDEIERRLQQDESLWGHAKDKIRYDYDGHTHRLVVRMPTAIHELFIARVEDSILSQLKTIREGSGDAAAFARKVQPARSTEIFLPVENAPFPKQSKYEPDASFWHEDAKYPGVIIEVAYSQKRKRLYRLAENYLLDSDASVQVVVGLDIEYGKKGSRKAALSIWRTRELLTDDGPELRADQVVADKVFRDDEGNPTSHTDLRLRLRHFAYQELVQQEMGDWDQELTISSEQLCDYLTAAEAKMRQAGSLGQHSVAPGVKKRKRLETPPEEITASDEARYVEREERAAKRLAQNDSDYEDMSSMKSSSE